MRKLVLLWCLVALAAALGAVHTRRADAATHGAAAAFPTISLVLKPSHPAADMPPGVITLTAPLYLGAQPSTAPVGLPGQAQDRYPILYEKVTSAEYVVAVSSTVADAWYQQAFGALGYSDGGLGRLFYCRPQAGCCRTPQRCDVSSGGATIETAREFFLGSPEEQTSPTITLHYYATGDGGTVIVYRAREIVRPIRPAWSHVPTNISSVVVTATVEGAGPTGSSLTLRRMVTDTATIGALVRAINGLQRPLTRALRHCASSYDNYPYRVTMLFTGRDGTKTEVRMMVQYCNTWFEVSGRTYTNLSAEKSAAPTLVNDLFDGQLPMSRPAS